MYKVMIVDDEPVIKQGLLCFVNWEALDCEVVCDAQNGIDAKEKLASHTVDIVLTDIKMPGMDGLELSKFINENYPCVKVIILTAFADFSYAQSAIKYNVVDFVVKTNPSEKIPDAINKAKGLIVQEKENEEKLMLLEEKANVRMSELYENFFKDVFNGILINEDLIHRKIGELGIHIENYYVILFDIHNISNRNPLNPEESHKFMTSVSNLLSMAFKNYSHYTVALERSLFVSVISISNSNEAYSLRAILETCNEILSMADHFMRFTASIGISQRNQTTQSLPIAFQEAQDALKGNFYNDNRISVFIPNTNPVSSSPGKSHSYADKIIDNLRLANPSKALSSLEGLMEEYKNNREPIESIKVASMLIASHCYKLLSGYRLLTSDLIDEESKLYKDIQESKNIHNLNLILKNLIETISQITASNDKNFSYLIKEAQNYIRDNYSKNITLQAIADHIHVNNSYLSRLYKKETGESIIDAINKYRIDTAKILLKNPQSKVFEVACSVGIEDPAYFTHVFTKYTGMSPKEFKVNNIN